MIFFVSCIVKQESLVGIKMGYKSCKEFTLNEMMTEKPQRMPLFEPQIIKNNSTSNDWCCPKHISVLI